MLVSISAFVVFLVVEVSAMLGNRDTRMPMCPNFSEPCRMRVMISDTNGALMETSSTSLCTCSPPYTCPHDWSDRRYAISRRLVSANNNITLQMLFCRRVQPKNFCRPGDISLVVKGSMILPMGISSYNCRCRRRQPLVLQERSFREDNLYYHSYACANHVSTCDQDEACMSMHHTSINYTCICPQDSHCRIPAEQWGHENSDGVCMP